MRIAVFPFTTRRTDDRQGPLARQVPRWVAGRLERAGADVCYVAWRARRGEQVAHVLVEGPLPPSVLVGECAELAATHALTGRSHLDDGRWTIEATLHAIDGESVRQEWTWVADDESLAAASEIGELTAALAAFVQVETEPPHLPADLPAVVAWALDADAQSLVAVGGLAALQHDDDAWRHLVAVLASEPSFEAADRRLRERIERWRQDGQLALALRAARGRARVAAGDGSAWELVAELAEARDDTELAEEALREQLTFSDDPRVRLRLGVLLVRSRRADEAVEHLRTAAVDAEQRDAAETYLGVALASIGELAEAIEFWTRVARECPDRRIARIAAENLERARAGS